jgi:hypothetical protein
MLDLTPENKILRLQAENLKKEYAELYEQWHYMVTYEEAILTSVYLQEMGQLKYDLLCQQTAIARLKQKIQLAQAYFNRNVQPDWILIEQKLQQQFEEYQQKIKMEAERLAAAKKYLSSGFLNEYEAQQLKSVYRLLVRKLHPDLNPGQSDYEKELFLRVQAAYDLCDLNSLNEVLLLMNNEGSGEKTELPDLAATVNHLTNMLKIIQEKIAKLNVSFPFIYRDKLRDDEWLKTEKEALAVQIDSYKKEIREKTEYLLLLESWKPELLH